MKPKYVNGHHKPRRAHKSKPTHVHAPVCALHHQLFKEARKSPLCGGHLRCPFRFLPGSWIAQRQDPRDGGGIDGSRLDRRRITLNKLMDDMIFLSKPDQFRHVKNCHNLSIVVEAHLSSFAGSACRVAARRYFYNSGSTIGKFRVNDVCLAIHGCAPSTPSCGLSILEQQSGLPLCGAAIPQANGFGTEANETKRKPSFLRTVWVNRSGVVPTASCPVRGARGIGFRLAAPCLRTSLKLPKSGD